MFFSLCDEGDVVLVLAPYYANFSKIMSFRNKVILHPIALDQKPFVVQPNAAENNVVGFGNYLSLVEEALAKFSLDGKTVKALLFSNPSNPLGRVATKEELTALLHFCKKHQLHCVCDEVYALSIYSKAKYVHIIIQCNKYRFVSASILAKELGMSDLVHVMYSFSKDFACSGLRCGILHTENANLALAVQKLSRFCPSSNLTQTTIGTLLADEQWVQHYVSTLQNRLQHANQLFCSILTDLQFTYFKSEAGLFVFIYLADFFALLPSDTKDKEDALYKHMLQHFKINLTPGSLTNYKEQGWFRICSANSDTVLIELGKRLAKMQSALQQMSK